MECTQLCEKIKYYWDSHVIHELSKYIRLPAVTPSYDPDWKERGAIDSAADMMAHWARMQGVKGLHAEIIHLEERTPMLFIEIPGEVDNTVLFYGHLDKMPPSEGWDKGLGPWKPVYKNGRLYGRGSVDDGYAFFAAVTAIKALQDEQIPHARCVIMIEACEEGGSYDLPAYMELLKDRIGEPELVFCIDTGCADYEHFYLTNSVRGYFSGTLRAEVLTGAVHSGGAGGIVPTAFQALQVSLDKIFNSKTGKVLLHSAEIKIPRERIKQAKATAAIDGEKIYSEFPFIEGVNPLNEKPEELLLNRSWRSAMAITGVAGIPSMEQASNVILPMNALRLSFRIPPNADPYAAAEEVKELVEEDTPFGAKVSFEPCEFSQGWSAPEMSAWLRQAVDEAARCHFDSEPLFIGEGGFISVLNLLQNTFPATQIVATGACGPGSNPHGPNEFLHIPMAKKVTCCIAHILGEHFKSIK